METIGNYFAYLCLSNYSFCACVRVDIYICIYVYIFIYEYVKAVGSAGLRSYTRRPTCSKHRSPFRESSVASDVTAFAFLYTCYAPLADPTRSVYNYSILYCTMP